MHGATVKKICNPGVYNSFLTLTLTVSTTVSHISHLYLVMHSKIGRVLQDHFFYLLGFSYNFMYYLHLFSTPLDHPHERQDTAASAKRHL
jgi:hypothetical protein